MKPELLHGIIQDLMKVPLMPKPEGHGATVTIIAGEKPHGEGALPTAPLDPDADGDADAMSPEHDKMVAKNKAIHAHMKDKPFK